MGDGRIGFARWAKLDQKKLPESICTCVYV